MERLNNLKEQLGIEDFKIRMNRYGAKARDNFINYVVNRNAFEKGFNQKLKSNLGNNGLDVSTLEELLDLDPEMINKLIAGNLDILDDIKVEEMPDEARALYLENEEKAKKLGEKLKELKKNGKSLGDPEFDEYNDLLTQLSTKNAELKRTVLESKMQIDPEIFKRNPATLIKMMKILQTPTNFKVQKASLPDELLDMQDSLIENFFRAKGFNDEELKERTFGERAMYPAQINDFLQAIANEPENALQEHSLDFFTLTQS